jgi:tetratricopeptide (TPR) repeat protein
MRKGDGEKAVYWGNRAFSIAEKNYHSRKKRGYADDTLYIECGINLGYAYELNKEYDKALEYYQRFIKRDENADIPRIHYKLGLPRQAFRKYCNCFKKEVVGFSNMAGYEQEHWQERIFRVIMCPSHPYNGCSYLAPFKNFDEFYTFMEKEYESHDSFEKYQYSDVMEIFRIVKSRAEVYEQQ